MRWLLLWIWRIFPFPIFLAISEPLQNRTSGTRPIERANASNLRLITLGMVRLGTSAAICGDESDNLMVWATRFERATSAFQVRHSTKLSYAQTGAITMAEWVAVETSTTF